MKKNHAKSVTTHRGLHLQLAATFYPYPINRLQLLLFQYSIFRYIHRSTENHDLQENM